MALPPEPLRELFPKVRLVVLAEVTEVLAQGPPEPKVAAPWGHTGVGQKVAPQTVRLRVERVLFGGDCAHELDVDKPAAPYRLKPRDRGPFLLDATVPRPLILGRYGPDTYSVTEIERVLRESPAR